MQKHTRTPSNSDSRASKPILKSEKEGQELEDEIRDLDNLYNRLFIGNQQFVSEKITANPTFFKDLSKTQTPKYLLIGCADSRVPPDQLTKTDPGEIFIHRNVANLVVHTDLNMMSVLQYAVDVLKVKHVIVMGHYGCGGVKASMEKNHHGLIDKWLRNIKDVQRLHWKELCACTDVETRFRLLVELNIREQVINLCKTSIIQGAWARGQTVAVHGWVYELSSGYIHELDISYETWHELEEIYELHFGEKKQHRNSGSHIAPLMLESRRKEEGESSHTSPTSKGAAATTTTATVK